MAAYEIADASPVFTLVDTRGPCRMQLAPGDQVWSGGMRGIVGGFVSDGTHEYGVTCGHVAVGPDLSDKSKSIVANVTASEKPAPMPVGGICDPKQRVGNPSVVINNIDSAVALLTTAVQPSGIKLAGSVRQADRISVQAQGGRLDFTVRSLAIAMSLKSGSDLNCFSPLVEMFPDTVTTNLGDSGAWGLKNAGTEWATMVVGADSVSSFGTDARDVHRWIESNAGLGRTCTIH